MRAAYDRSVPTLFTRILEGELPGRFVHRDDRCGAFLSIAPMNPGHTLVVPFDEVDHWLDLDADVVAHLMLVARRIGQAQMLAFSPARVALLIAGAEVPHAHLHVVPFNREGELSFRNADQHAGEEAMDAAAAALVAALESLDADRDS
jgi:histidine triad (HIT) family protein